MIKRIIAMVVIFACSWTAWAVLSLVIHMRTEDKSDLMRDAVGELWGTEHTQVAPQVSARWTTVTKREVKRLGASWEYVDREDEGDEGQPADGGGAGEPAAATPATGGDTRPVTTELVSRKIVTEKTEKEGRDKARKGVGRGGSKRGDEPERRSFEVTEERHTAEMELTGSDVRVGLDVDHRKKGLLWFATYAVDFGSEYLVENAFDQTVTVQMSFPFPSHDAVYDNMKVEAAGRDDLSVTTESGQMIARFTVPPESTQAVRFGYRSRGMDRWNYRFGSDVRIVKNFRLEMSTDFGEIDFPAGTISPDAKQRTDGGGWQLSWDKESLVSGLEIGMLMPQRINPGPLAQAMSLHAPVSLFFFFFVIFILQVLRDIRIHPMNYFFLAAAFFAFNLLFSYLVDHLELPLSFGIASAVSIALVVSYLRLVVGVRFALVEAGISQLVYQILFSLAHFFEGYTGLTVTVGAILTLAIVMIATARVDWFSVFKGKAPEPCLRAPAPQGTEG